MGKRLPSWACFFIDEMGMVTIYPQGLLQWFIEIPSPRVLQSTNSLSPWREESVSCAHSFSRETDRVTVRVRRRGRDRQHQQQNFLKGLDSRHL